MRETYLNKICTWTVLGNSGAFVLLSGKIIDKSLVAHILVPSAWMFIFGLIFAIIFNFLTLLELEAKYLVSNGRRLSVITVISLIFGVVSSLMFFAGCIYPLVILSSQYKFKF